MGKEKTPKKVDVKHSETVSTPAVTVSAPVEEKKQSTDCTSCVGGLYTINSETGKQVICKHCKGTTKI